MRELLELNRYIHDFTAAMWVCGSILIWLVSREVSMGRAPADSVGVLQRVCGRVAYLSVPSLLIALGSGGVRALTFRQYEYVGEITNSLIAVLIIKHVIFVAFIIWGVMVHRRSRRLVELPRAGT